MGIAHAERISTFPARIAIRKKQTQMIETNAVSSSFEHFAKFALRVSS
jgi:hypothetical protein